MNAAAWVTACLLSAACGSVSGQGTTGGDASTADTTGADATDGADETDGTETTDATDQSDGADETDGADGTSAADAVDGTDGTTGPPPFLVPVAWDDTLKDGWIEPDAGECDSPTVRAFVQFTPDGDTIHLTNGEKVRLLGVSASETTGGECWSSQAKDSLITLAPKGTEVCLLPDPKADNRDIYDRLLRYVFVPHPEDGRWVLANGRQIRIGYARAYTSFLWGLRFRNDIVAAEFEARTENAGGWDACGWEPR